jgi:hypothetical protein
VDHRDPAPPPGVTITYKRLGGNDERPPATSTYTLALHSDPDQRWTCDFATAAERIIAATGSTTFKAHEALVSAWTQGRADISAVGP